MLRRPAELLPHNSQRVGASAGWEPSVSSALRASPTFLLLILAQSLQLVKQQTLHIGPIACAATTYCVT
jgi:hypothetical protein